MAIELFASKKTGVMPTKHTMNLYYKQDKTSGPATVGLYVIFALVVAIALGKVLFFDVWQQANAAKQQVTQSEQRLAALAEDTANYDTIKQEYLRYVETDDERTMVNRLEVLKLIDENIASTATVGTITVTDDEVQLQISGVSLGQISSIVQALEESDIVASTSVSTATAEGAGDMVTANLTITLVSPEEATANASASAQNATDNADKAVSASDKAAQEVGELL